MIRLLVFALVALVTLVVLSPLSVFATGTTVPQTGEVGAYNLDNNWVRLTIITNGGYAGFTVKSDWNLVAMHGNLPVVVVAFEIPDSVDAGTKDSTNLAVSMLDPDAPKAKVFLERVIGGTTSPEPDGKWTLYQRKAPQGPTLYTIIDAVARVADVTVVVRLAWPHLSGEPKGHDAQMRTLLEHVINSVQGGVGAYRIHSNEVFRRSN
jgi:hypothetical protein